ncbi:MAG: phosphoribosylformylglycinamidine synthase subunit PurQ [Verrucomicrobiota bacterium]|nr:phosphoribosylformylglycinamidine synthase subunit PurQ [Verrucomicrobiota bacterium]
MEAKVLIITGFGLNCEIETKAAFETAGAEATLIHLNDLLEKPEKLLDFNILAFIGGFSFGDHLGAGTVFANRIKTGMHEALKKFIDGNKLIIGICNGFQTITRLGLVPAIDGAYFEQQVALAHNHEGVFRDDWVTLKAEKDSPCVFTAGIDNIELPIRHGEGCFTVENPEILQIMEKKNLIALRYASPETGLPTDEFPHNPNGSVNSIAGICDKTGRIFGLMPHPEAYIYPYNHPQWTRQKINAELPNHGQGLILFENAVNYIKNS